MGGFVNIFRALSTNQPQTERKTTSPYFYKTWEGFFSEAVYNVFTICNWPFIVPSKWASLLGLSWNQSMTKMDLVWKYDSVHRIGFKCAANVQSIFPNDDSANLRECFSDRIRIQKELEGGKIFTRLTDWRTDGWRHLPLLLSWNCGSEVGMKWVRFGQTERMADTELNQMLDHLMPFTLPSFESTTMVILTKTKTYMKECQFCSALDRYTKTADWAMRITESIFVVKFVILHGHTVRPRNDFWVVSHSRCSRRDGII